MHSQQISHSRGMAAYVEVAAGQLDQSEQNTPAMHCQAACAAALGAMSCLLEPFESGPSISKNAERAHNRQLFVNHRNTK